MYRGGGHFRFRRLRPDQRLVGAIIVQVFDLPGNPRQLWLELPARLLSQTRQAFWQAHGAWRNGLAYRRKHNAVAFFLTKHLDRIAVETAADAIDPQRVIGVLV